MGLFDQVVSALDNPNQEASSDQLGSILSVVGQLSGSQGIDAASYENPAYLGGCQPVRGVFDDHGSRGAEVWQSLLVTRVAHPGQPRCCGHLSLRQEAAANRARCGDQTVLDPQTRSTHTALC